MLGHRGIPQAQEFGELPDRTLPIDQLTDDQEPVPVGQRLQQFARLVGGRSMISLFTFILAYIRNYEYIVKRLHDGRGEPATQLVGPTEVTHGGSSRNRSRPERNADGV